jgi:hypothetical protein
VNDKLERERTSVSTNTHSEQNVRGAGGVLEHIMLKSSLRSVLIKYFIPSLIRRQSSPPIQSKMFLRLCLFFAELAAVLSMLGSVAAELSPSQPRRLISEGSFVRGMMAADHQLGLYMALSETNPPPPPPPPRASTTRTAFTPYPRGGGAEVDMVESRVHRFVDQAREAAVNFASVVQRRALSIPPARRKA